MSEPTDYTWLARWLLTSGHNRHLLRDLAAILAFGWPASRLRLRAPTSAGDLHAVLELFDEAAVNGHDWHSRVPELAALSSEWAKVTPVWKEAVAAARAEGKVKHWQTPSRVTYLLSLHVRDVDPYADQHPHPFAPLQNPPRPAPYTQAPRDWRRGHNLPQRVHIPQIEVKGARGGRYYARSVMFRGTDIKLPCGCRLRRPWVESALPGHSTRRFLTPLDWLRYTKLGEVDPPDFDALRDTVMQCMATWRTPPTLEDTTAKLRALNLYPSTTTSKET